MIEYTVKVSKKATTWFLDGWLHREDGPAVENINGYKAWFINGKRHREDGPAITYPDGTNEWYLNDALLTEDEFNQQTNSFVNKTIDIDGKKYKLVAID